MESIKEIMDVDDETLCLTKRDESHKNNNVNNLVVKENTDIRVLIDYVKQSCLSNKCQFINSAADIEDVCKEFMRLLSIEDFNLDEISTIFTVASLSYYTQPTIESIQCRLQFLQKAAEYADTLNPLHLHVISKRLWELFKTKDISFTFKLLNLMRLISVHPGTCRGIAICIVWSIICEIKGTSIDMHRFHRFNSLHSVLNEIDCPKLYKQGELRTVYALVQCIGFFINVIVCNPNIDFNEAGYRPYFTYNRTNLEKLRKILGEIVLLSTQTSSKDAQLCKTINDYLKFNLIDILDSKLKEIKKD